MSQNEYWCKEEFEDLVARSLIAMYETKIKKYKESRKSSWITQDILNRVKSMGCYFPVSDRIVAVDHNEKGIASAVQTIDVINDGRPDYAVYCCRLNSSDYKNQEDSMRFGSYLEISYMERLNSFPKDIKYDHEGRKYRLAKLWMRNNKIEGISEYVVINSKGKIFGTYWIRDNYNHVTGRVIKEVVAMENIQSEEENSRAENIVTVDASITIQSWQDRRYLWNVVAKEGIAKATFSVYPEEIKSLFYAREMPMTETGRKRPILHWVAAHNRRIKNGIDIDIEKHLRGINEFVYQGTQFIITRPLKKGNLYAT